MLPVHHVNGLVLFSLTSWLCGSSAVLCDRFRSDRFWSDVENEAATVCSMVPSLLEFLLSEGARTAPAHFREVLCGAGPLMPDTVSTSNGPSGSRYVTCTASPRPPRSPR